MDPITGAALISSGASLLGGIFGNSSAKKAAKRQEQFQERMANTVHQREVIDLKAAGLNPMLSAMGGNGAPAPQGASYQPQDVLTPAMNSALQARSNYQAVENLKMQNYVLKTQGIKNDTEAALAASQAAKVGTENKILQSNSNERDVKGQLWDSIGKVLAPAKELFDGSFSAKSNHYKELLPPPSYKK